MKNKLFLACFFLPYLCIVNAKEADENYQKLLAVESKKHTYELIVKDYSKYLVSNFSSFVTNLNQNFSNLDKTINDSSNKNILKAYFNQTKIKSLPKFNLINNGTKAYAYFGDYKVSFTATIFVNGQITINKKNSYLDKKSLKDNYDTILKDLPNKKRLVQFIFNLVFQQAYAGKEDYLFSEIDPKSKSSYLLGAILLITDELNANNGADAFYQANNKLSDLLANNLDKRIKQCKQFKIDKKVTKDDIPYVTDSDAKAGQYKFPEIEKDYQGVLELQAINNNGKSGLFGGSSGVEAVNEVVNDKLKALFQAKSGSSTQFNDPGTNEIDFSRLTCNELFSAVLGSRKGSNNKIDASNCTKFEEYRECSSYYFRARQNIKSRSVNERKSTNSAR